MDKMESQMEWRVGREGGDCRVMVNEFPVLGVPGGVVVPFSELGNDKEGREQEGTSLLSSCVKTPHFHCRHRFDPGPGTKILHPRAVITNKSNVLFMWFCIIIFFHLLDTFSRYRSIPRRLRLGKVTCLSGASRMSE